MLQELKKLIIDLELNGSAYKQRAEAVEIDGRYAISVSDISGPGRESVVFMKDTELLPIISFAKAHGYGWNLQACDNEVVITLYPEEDR